MKILLIHNRYQEAGGEETALAAQVALLEANGHSVCRYQRSNDEIRTWGLPQRLAALPDTIYSRRSVSDLRALVARERPDIAHIHNVFPLLSPAVYRVLHDLRVPMVQTVHNFRLLCPNGMFYTQGHICERCKGGNTLHAIPRRCYRDSVASSALYAAAVGLHRQWGTFGLIDRYLALTPFAADRLVESGLIPRTRLRVLGNFVADPLPETGFAERPPSVVYIGRLSEEKGVSLLVEAMGRLPEVPLHLIGDGPARAALEKQVRVLGLRHVTFHGYVAGREKYERLRRASVAVIPSRLYENFPFAALENLAVGTPVIVPNHGCFPYVVEDGQCGRLFVPNNVASLASILQQMLADPELPLMRARARDLVEREYSAQAHYAALSQHYEELLSEHLAITPELASRA